MNRSSDVNMHGQIVICSSPVPLVNGLEEKHKSLLSMFSAISSGLTHPAAL